VKASILFYFLHQPNSIVSKTIILRPPCTPRRSRIISYPSPIAPACFWLVVVWHSLSGGHLRTQLYFFFQLLSSINSTAKKWQGVYPTRSAPAVSPPQCPSHLRRRIMVGCCVPPSNGGHLRLTHPPPLSYFCQLIRRTKRQAAVLPTRSDPASPLLQCTL
jgi:hypothetical protein